MRFPEKHEDILYSPKMLQAAAFNLHIEFFHQLTANGIHTGFAKFDPTAKRTIEMFILHRVISFGDKDAVFVAKNANSEWTDSFFLHFPSKM
jgi:hypothetical protein